MFELYLTKNTKKQHKKAINQRKTAFYAPKSSNFHQNTQNSKEIHKITIFPNFQRNNTFFYKNPKSTPLSKENWNSFGLGYISAVFLIIGSISLEKGAEIRRSVLL